MQELLDKLEALRGALEELKVIVEGIDARDSQGYDFWQVMVDEIESLAQAPYSYSMREAQSQAVYLYGAFTREYFAIYGTPIPQPLRRAFIKLMGVLGVKRKRLGNLAEGEKFGDIIVLKKDPARGCAWVIKGGREDVLDLGTIITSFTN